MNRFGRWLDDGDDTMYVTFHVAFGFIVTRRCAGRAGLTVTCPQDSSPLSTRGWKSVTESDILIHFILWLFWDVNGLD